MAHSTYVVIDIVALTLAAAVAAAFLVLGHHIAQELADQLPPALSGSPKPGEPMTSWHWLRSTSPNHDAGRKHRRAARPATIL
jgi:hypothetical protein